jgi:hypothetical protein
MTAAAAEEEEEEEDFETRQKVARQRVEAFERAQAEKRKVDESKALQAHYQAIEEKRHETLAQVEAVKDSLANDYHPHNKEEIMADGSTSSSIMEQADLPSSNNNISNNMSNNNNLSKAEQKKQEKAALEARLAQQEAARLAALKLVQQQQKASAEERAKARERLREQQRLEQQRLADAQINQTMAHMEELNRIAQEQQERLMSLQSARKSFVAKDMEMERAKRNSTYVTVRSSEKTMELLLPIPKNELSRRTHSIRQKWGLLMR